MPLSSLLLPHADPAARGQLEAAADLEQTLQRILEEGQSAWPDVHLEPAAFLKHVAQRLPAEGDPVAALEGTHAGDLYLACACTLGDTAALAAFDHNFISQINRYLARSDSLPAVADEIKQVVRTKLLVGRDGVLPRIASYSGRGPLGAWLRVTATRAALRLRDRMRANEAREGQGAVMFPASDDPELEYLRRNYADDFRAAFETTLKDLEPKERTLLRLHHLDGMTTEAIATLYSVSARTVKRWLAATRKRILDETHRRLGERLRISTADLEKLLGLLRSRLEVSIVRLLDDPEEQD